MNDFTITDNMSTIVVWAIIDDLLDSIKQADDTPDQHIYHTVVDYVTNHYGE